MGESSGVQIASFLAFNAILTVGLRFSKIGAAARHTQVTSQDLAKKFTAKDGITFYYFPRSPCARRVWLTLLEKNIPFNQVMVNLIAGEQRHPSYLKINPQGCCFYSYTNTQIILHPFQTRESSSIGREKLSWNRRLHTSRGEMQLPFV